MMEQKMFFEVLGKETEDKLRKITGFSWVRDCYLAGGTAAALHYGHRKSHDLDLFTKESFGPALVRKDLSRIGPFTVTHQDKNTLIGAWNKVKLSLMTYPYKLVGKCGNLFGVKIASVRDIALMKMDAVSSRGTKRDFIDLFWILKNGGDDLKGYCQMMKTKYEESYSLEHLIKSLVYFKDAEKDPMPIMLKKLNWNEVKSYFLFQVSSLSKKFIL